MGEVEDVRFWISWKDEEEAQEEECRLNKQNTLLVLLGMYHDTSILSISSNYHISIIIYHNQSHCTTYNHLSPITNHLSPLKYEIL